jgi:hypothetical protein
MGRRPPPLVPYSDGHESGYSQPGFRHLSPSAPYEVEDGGVWYFGYLRQWKLFPDGWYGLILWGNHHHPLWVPKAKLRPAPHREVRSRRHR